MALGFVMPAALPGRDRARGRVRFCIVICRRSFGRGHADRHMKEPLCASTPNVMQIIGRLATTRASGSDSHVAHGPVRLVVLARPGSDSATAGSGAVGRRGVYECARLTMSELFTLMILLGGTASFFLAPVRTRLADSFVGRESGP